MSCFKLIKRDGIDNRSILQIVQDDEILCNYFPNEFNIFRKDSKLHNTILIHTKCKIKNNICWHKVLFNDDCSYVSYSDLKRIIIANGYLLPEHFIEKNKLYSIIYNNNKDVCNIQ